MKSSIKLAIAAVGLVGSLSYNSAEVEFLEDDQLFAKTTVQQEAGWSWGISAAAADPDRPIGGPDRDPGGCIGTNSCSIDQTDPNYADEAYLDYQWERYDECLEYADTDSQIQRCDDKYGWLWDVDP